jgi:hypothetical protein
MAAASETLPRGSSTICLPIDQARYQVLIDSPVAFRGWLDESFAKHPELFPKAFAGGYLLKDIRTSAKLGLRLRRIECKATRAAFSVRPSFVLPYLVGYTDDVANPLFLRSFGVPFWALAQVFGQHPMYYYRLEVGLGRNSIVGTTLRQAAVPEHLIADEHHQVRNGLKNYIATTVAAGCCLGAELSQNADACGLQGAYGVFKAEAQNVQPGYTPKTVNVDGWKATRLAWLGLFPLVLLLRCFLHGWLSIRDGCKKHPYFASVSEKIWHAFHAPDRRTFAQRLRRLREWAQQKLSGLILEKTLKLCGRAPEYALAYEHPGGQRTSASLDRVMRSMNRYFEDCQHLHGSEAAANRHARAWALLYNFRPWHPATTRANKGWRCPAERLNKHRYHDNWLHNLLVSASLAGYRR